MPYIKSEFRGNLDPYIARIRLEVEDQAERAGGGGGVGGQVNYIITKLLWELCRITDGGHRPVIGKYNYALLNELVGALESAKAEFQRRVVGLYEDTKAAENGDIV
jgi:hypothetical protein